MVTHRSSPRPTVRQRVLQHHLKPSDDGGRFHGHFAAMTIFLLLSLTLYTLIHISVILALKAWLPRGHVTGIVMTLWGVGVLSLFVARIQHNPLTNLIYRIGVTWMGIAFLLFLVLFPATMFAIALGASLNVLILLPTFTLIAISIFLAHWTRIRTLEVAVAKLPKDDDGFRLVQLTDLHIGEIYGPTFLKHIVRRTNLLRPDLIVITGDVFDGGGKPYPHMIEPLRELYAPHGVYYVRGNHDVYEGISETDEALREVGINILDDAITSVAGLSLVGLSYPADLHDPKREVLAKLVEKAKKKHRRKPIILLRHEPRDPIYAADLGVDLMLSGHTHNGQLWPLNYLVGLQYPYRIGHHRIKQMTLYIGPGIGTWGPPLRLGSRSEITLHILRHLD